MKLSRKKILPWTVLLLGLIILAAPQGLFARGAQGTSGSAAPAPATRFVKDSNGVDVEIPYVVTKAAPVIGAFAQITEVVTGGSGKISAAATMNITPYFRQVFPDYARSNPNNYSAMSVEDLIASGAQVAYGPNVIFSAEQREQLARAGITFVEINNVASVQDMCDSFQIIGNILGDAEAAKAREFVNYYLGNINTAKSRTANIAANNKITFLSLFYSAGAYTTTNGRDISNEYIEAAGGVNVAKDYMGVAGANSLTVDAERILAWNPQVIMTSNQTGREAVLNDPAMRTVSAVSSGKVYVCPSGIYLWSVRSGEGAMLPQWIGTKLYPDLFADTDMRAVVRDFFNNFYNYKIPESEIDTVLAGEANTSITR
jgi:iron complex transport system substrate-binding protein